VRREEVLEHGQPLTEVGPDRDVDDPSFRVEHQTTHASHLADLVHVSLRARVGHHEDRVLATKVPLHVLRELVAGVVPDHFKFAKPLVSVTSRGGCRSTVFGLVGLSAGPLGLDITRRRRR
jgi:hypothetical protein